MRISFHSIDDDIKAFYDVEAKYENNILEFKDKTQENTNIKIIIENDEILLSRYGDVEGNMSFKLNELTDGNYKNNIGLEFDFKILCTNLIVSNKKILIEYQMIIDEEFKNEHKIWILFH